jgi:transposase
MMATRPVDFRKGVDGLAALVRDTMGADPFSGTVYVFRAKRADRVKLVYWDGTGESYRRALEVTRAGCPG